MISANRVSPEVREHGDDFVGRTVSSDVLHSVDDVVARFTGANRGVFARHFETLAILGQEQSRAHGALRARRWRSNQLVAGPAVLRGTCSRDVAQHRSRAVTR